MEKEPKVYHLESPDSRIVVKIDLVGRIAFSVCCNNLEIIHPSPVSLTVDGHILGENPQIVDIQRRMISETISPVIRQKSSEIPESCNELRLKFEHNYELIFRTYDYGVAYRFETCIAGRIRVLSEEASFNFDRKDIVYFPQEDSFFSHNERPYRRLALDEITPGSFCSLPVLVHTRTGCFVLITEADLYDYPGVWLKVEKKQTLSGILPPVALKEKQENDRDVRVTEYADYIARTDGTRSYPWRVMAIAQNDAELITNELVYLLSRPLQLQDTSWIKPGKVAWDWWNDWNIYGVDFEAGVNTQTYKYYIDFASKHGIEYIILDEGWYKLGDCLSINPDLDMEELMAYARNKRVGVILWVIWKTLDNQLEEALDRFEKWGISGIKVDFMQRDDQWMVNYYWKIAHEAAKRKMLVDFHGSYKPTGLRRTFPNVITREGVMGMEHCKSSELVTPKHNVTLPFIRMVAGPMDYTPGAMINAQKECFRVVNSRPMSMGTRCHQLAMYVIYESPLQMLADSPSNYMREPECMEFLARVPTVWDETRVLHAKVAEYIVVARRSGDEWYVGAMTDEQPREFTINLSFLGSGSHKVDYYQDGINAHRYGGDFKMESMRINRKQEMVIRLATGGGWAARIYK